MKISTPKNIYLSITVFLIAIGLLNAQEKIAVVLSGGGAQGIAHIGVLKAFEEYRIPIDLIVGSSAGSLVAGMYASGVSVAEMEAMVKDGTIASLFMGHRKELDYPIWNRKNHRLGNLSVGWTQGIFVGPSSLLNDWLIEKELFVLTASAQVYSNSNFDSLLIPFRTVAADLTHKKSYSFKSGSIALAMKASMSIPLIYSPVIQDNRMLVDGGIYMKMPVSIAVEEKADFIIAINTEDGPQNLNELDDIFDYFDEINRTVLSSGDSSDVKGWDYFFRVDTRGHHIMDFAGGSDLLDAGYDAGVKAALALNNILNRKLDYDRFQAKQNAVRRHLDGEYFAVDYKFDSEFSHEKLASSIMHIDDSLMITASHINRFTNYLLMTDNYETIIPSMSGTSNKIQLNLGIKPDLTIKSGLDINSYQGFNLLLETLINLPVLGKVNINSVTGNRSGFIGLEYAPHIHRFVSIPIMIRPQIVASHNYHHINVNGSNLEAHKFQDSRLNIGFSLIPGWNRELKISTGLRYYNWTSTDSTLLESVSLPSTQNKVAFFSVNFHEDHISKNGLHPLGWKFDIMKELLKYDGAEYSIQSASVFGGLHIKQRLFLNSEISYRKIDSGLPLSTFSTVLAPKASIEKYPLYLMTEETLNYNFHVAKTFLRKDIFLGLTVLQSYPQNLKVSYLETLSQDGLTGFDLSLSYDSLFGPIQLGWSFSEVENFQPSSWAAIKIRL